MTITAVRDQVRLLIGDVDENAQLFQNDELDWFLSERAQNVRLAAADACEALARKYARAYDFETDGQKFRRSQMSTAYRQLAADLRARADGIDTVDVTRIDGYSDDIANQEVAAGSSTINPRRRFYGQPDRIP